MYDGARDSRPTSDNYSRSPHQCGRNCVPQARDQEDDFDLFDYIRVEAVQEEAREVHTPDPPLRTDNDTDWKSIDAAVVLLIGSQEFTTILHAVRREMAFALKRTQNLH